MNYKDAARWAMYGALPAAVYGANALLGGEDERWDRTAINTAGNIAGAGSGALLGSVAGLPGMVAGAISGGLAGGYASDQLANLVDPTYGHTGGGEPEREIGRPTSQELIAYHLQSDPIAQQAYYQEQLRQARMQKKEMDRQRALQYQAQMSQMGGM